MIRIFVVVWLSC